MSIASLALTAAASASTLALVLALAGHKQAATPARVRWLILGAAGLTAMTFLWLLGRFIAGDVSIGYVHLYTHRDLPLQWRVAGTWTGREGSLLLWATMATGVAALFAWKAPKSRGHSATLTALLALLVPLQWALLWSGSWSDVFSYDPFAPTAGWLLDGRPNGSGLNPTLKSPFILIHPPLMFVAYALTMVPAAGALAHWVTGHGTWSRISQTWSRVGWMIYTFAMGLGAMWAYVTLNFGGYWAWDPVEVANLLPWLALTLYLHAQVRHERSGAYPIVGPVLAVLPWLLTLFSTFSTRSGLWVSVHAFTDPSNTFRPDPSDRLIDILAADGSLHPYVGMSLALVAVALALMVRRLAMDTGKLGKFSQALAFLFGAFASLALVAPFPALAALLDVASIVAFGHVGFGLLGLAFAAVVAAGAPALAEEEEGQVRWKRLDHEALARLSIIVLSTGLLVLWLFHVAAVQGWSQEIYEQRLPFLAAPVVLGLTLMQVRALKNTKRAVQATIGTLVAAVVLGAATTPGYGFILACVVLVAISLMQILRVAAAGKGRERLGRRLLVLAALLNVVFWLNPPTALGWGSLVLITQFPTQAVFGTAALVGLWWALRTAAGRAPRSPSLAYVWNGVLGGFLITPILALAAWSLTNRHAPRKVGPQAKARLRQVAMYGLHLSIGCLLLGYGTSTYLRDEVSGPVELENGLQFDGFGSLKMGMDGALLRSSDGLFVDVVEIELTSQRGGWTLSPPPATMQYEPGLGAHMPTPAIMRLVDRDLYVATDAILVEPGGTCFAEGTVAAYAPSERLCTDDVVTQVQLRVVSLPGVSLLWSGLVLLTAAMGLLLWSRPDGPPTEES